jgi:hypothetical protein
MNFNLINQLFEAKKQAFLATLQRYQYSPDVFAQKIQTAFIPMRIEHDFLSYEEREADRLLGAWLIALQSEFQIAYAYYNAVQQAQRQISWGGGAVFPMRPSGFSSAPMHVFEPFLQVPTSISPQKEVVIKIERVTETVTIIQPIPARFGEVEGRFFCQTELKPLAIAIHRLLNSDIDRSITSANSWCTKLSNANILNIRRKLSSLKVEVKNIQKLPTQSIQGEDTALNEALRKFVEENYPKIKDASLDKGKKTT